MKKPRILAVDDEKGFTDILRQYFEPRGYEIDIALDGNKALDLVRMKKYDVVLLDLKMTGPNGDQVMADMKKLDKNIKVIFISAYSDKGKTREMLLKAGAYDFIEKPITSLKLVEDTINRAVSGVKGKEE